MSSTPSGDTPRPLSDFWQPRHWPVWLALAGMRLLAFCPYRMQLAAGRLLGRMAGLVLRKRRHIAAVNLALCFPQLDAAERDALLRQCENGGAPGRGAGRGASADCHGW